MSDGYKQDCDVILVHRYVIDSCSRMTIYLLYKPMQLLRTGSSVEYRGYSENLSNENYVCQRIAYPMSDQLHLVHPC